MNIQFEKWWENEGWESYRDYASEVKELCRKVWEKRAYCAKEDLNKALNSFDGQYRELEWTTQPPQQTGTYLFQCDEISPDITTVLVTRCIEDGELWAEMDGEFRPVKDWCNGLTDPQWKICN